MAAVKYLYPLTAAPGTPPSAAETKDLVVAILDAHDAAEDSIVIHNMMFTAAELLLGAPVVNMNRVSVNGRTAEYIVSFQSTAQTTFAQLACGASAADAVVVTIRRPHTIGN
jgi:hypothetical protein